MKDKTKRLILIGSFATVLIVLAVALPLLTGAPKLSVLEPRTVLTPEPAREEDDVLAYTPVPTQAAPVGTPVPVYPQKAVNVLVNGTPLFAVDSREAAEQLVRLYLEECAAERLEKNDVLLSASIDAEIATVPADGSVEYVAFDAALNKLRKNRSLIPVRRAVERVAVLSETPAVQTVYSSLLPQGARMLTRCGVEGRTLVYTETLYKDGLAVSQTETMRTPIRTAVARSVLIGSYRYTGAAPAPDTLILNEGSRGAKPQSLSFVAPVRGKLSGSYGLATGEMRYGVDYTAAPDTRIVAPESGTVIFLGDRPGYGFVIEIRHEEGFVSRISVGAKAAVSDLALEKHVTKGETIGYLPQIESQRETTLHYELLIDGIPYNPLFYLPAQ